MRYVCMRRARGVRVVCVHVCVRQRCPFPEVVHPPCIWCTASPTSWYSEWMNGYLFHFIIIIIIIIIRQPLCPVVWRRPQHAVSKLACLFNCAVLCQIVPLQYMSRSSLHLLAGLPCRLFLSLWSPSGNTRGPSVVFEAVDMPWPGPFNFSHIADNIYDFCPLPDPLMLVFLPLMLNILLSILVCAATSLFCACLANVEVSAPYATAGSTQELYPCLFRQTARLLLKMSRCLAYAAQSAMILRCISLSWFCSLRL